MASDVKKAGAAATDTLLASAGTDSSASCPTKKQEEGAPKPEEGPNAVTVGPAAGCGDGGGGRRPSLTNSIVSCSTTTNNTTTTTFSRRDDDDHNNDGDDEERNNQNNNSDGNNAPRGDSDDPAEDDDQNMSNERKGWLMKRSRLSHKWKKKWFLLKNADLFYGGDPQSTSKRISLVNAEISETHMDKKSFAFRIKPRNHRRAFYIHAENELEQNNWMQAICFAKAAGRLGDNSQACVLQ